MTKRSAVPKRLPAAFFQNDAGTMPVRDWLLSLSDDDRKIIGDEIRTAEFGWRGDAAVPLDRWPQRAVGDPQQPQQRPDQPRAVMRP